MLYKRGLKSPLEITPQSILSAQFPFSIARLIAALHRLPGIGEKSATRLAFHLLRSPEGVARELGEAARELRTGLHYCRTCQNLTEQQLCNICASPKREAGQICVVAEPLDVVALEQAGAWHGVYHVLHGVLDPLAGIGPEQLTIAALITRVAAHPPTEIILALNPSTEGEATALYLARQLAESGVKVSRLARGLPTGAELTYADEVTLAAALAGRREY